MAAKLGQVMYRLELPADSRVHPVFHVSLLKKVSGQHTVAAKFPTYVGMEENGFEPERILLTHWGWQGDSRGLNLLVKWIGKSEEEATRMSEAVF